MTSSANHRGSEARTLSHDEAEQLISARFDGPLDPIENRDLLLHLAGCPSCTAFAVQMEVMARQLESLPMLPASPTVSRQVRETIYTSPSFWDRLRGTIQSGHLSAMPAAVTALVLLVSVATVLLVQQQQSSDSTPVTAIEAPSNLAQIETVAPTQSSESAVGVNQDRSQPTSTARVIQSPTSDQQLAEIDTNRFETPVTPTSDETSAASGSQSNPTSPAEEGGSISVEPTSTAADTGVTKTTDGQNAGETQATEPTTTIEQAIVAETDGANADASDAAKSPTASPTTVETETATTPTADDVVVAAVTDNESAGSGGEVASSPQVSATASATAEVMEHSPTATVTTIPTNEPAPTATPTATDVATDTPKATATPTPLPTQEPTHTIVPSPTATMEEQPQVQPTIAPSGGSAIQSTTNNEPETSTEETGQSDQAIIASSAGSTDNETDSPQIESADDNQTNDETTNAADQNTPSNDDVGGETQSPESGSAAILDQAPVVATLPPGTAAPSGRLEFRPQLDLFVVTTADGQLAVASTNGDIVAALGPGGLPVWSPEGIVLLYNDYSGVNPRAAVWDSDTGNIYPVGSESDSVVVDTPAGWLGSQLYYQRTYPDEPGHFQLRVASWDGSGDSLVYEAYDIYPVTQRPVAAGGGIILADASRWIIIYPDGSESDLEANGFGSVGAPILSPGGTLIAYEADGSVFVAGVDAPGTPYNSAIPFQGGFGSGFAFATSGEQIAVSAAGGLDFYDIYGNLQATASSSAPISPPYWVQDQVYFLQITNATELKAASADAIYSAG